jgi:protoporphyrinogen oxidase
MAKVAVSVTVPQGEPGKGPAVVIGGGPAGLTAAWELVERQVAVTVLEKCPLPGGIARTEQYNGYYFDIGGHRFFTKLAKVNRLWHTWLQDEFVTRPRKSRIYYHGHFFDYPLRLGNTLHGLGLVESFHIVASYGWSKLFPYRREENLEQWVSNRFGKRLYTIFFKTYTEKVWGIACTEIRAEWAAQRIKGLSLIAAVKNALLPNKVDGIKTLIESFEYPRRGPGQMWQRVCDLLHERGQKVLMDAEALKIQHDGQRVSSVLYADGDQRRLLPANTIISSMPLPELIARLDPPPPSEVQAAARQLTYRDFLTVILIFDQPDLFSDNWLYIHSPEVKVGRVQNFKNWSGDMVPDPETTSLGLEYFCTVGDALWTMTDAELIELGQREIAQIGLVGSATVIDATVVRQTKAYPIYDAVYADHLAVIKQYLNRFGNLYTIGRNGLHKYNNQDHSMLTAILAVENVFGAQHDLWEVNTERSYHEEVRVKQETQ